MGHLLEDRIVRGVVVRTLVSDMLPLRCLSGAEVDRPA